MTTDNEGKITVRPGNYCSYDPPTTLEEARAAFIKQYGVEPDYVWRHNIVLAGPKPERGQGDG